MQAFAATARVLRFGVFELDAASGELRRHGQKVRLPDQSFQILLLLLSRPGEVITRDELRQQLWTSDTFVDFDVGLNSAVRKLREALDDSAENPRFVETLPRRGYRFIASVLPVLAEKAPVLEPVTMPPPRRGRSQWVAGATVVAIVIAVLASALVYQRGWWQLLYRGPATEGIRSLAVLPFENLTGDASQDYLVDGITDALTTTLAQAGGFHVISRTSAMQYRSAKKSLPAIAQEMNVDAVLEGSIVRSGHDVRVTAQLIDAATDRHIWARSYQGELNDVLELQQQIGRAIAAALQRQVVPVAPARANSARGVSPEAYDAYLNGTLVMGRNSPEGFRNAVAYFDDAVARDPDFAEAHAALGQAQLQLLFGGPLSPREVIPKAEAAVRRALQLDDSLAQAHRTLGTILNLFYWRNEEAQREMRRARELSTSNDTRPIGTAILIQAGRVEEAIAQAEIVSKRDPKSFNAHVSVATAYRAAGQHDLAIARLHRALEIDPRANRAYFQLGITFVMMGRLDDAINALETAVRLSQSNPRVEAYLGYVYAAAGRPADARRTLTALESRARQQYVSSFGLALIHDALGEKASALAALERAFDDRAVEFAQMSQYPPFKTIASDPRYQTLMRRIGKDD